MTTSTTILPGVKSIYAVKREHLPSRVDLQGICRMPVAILTTLMPIPFCDSPECSCITQSENGAKLDTASLKFHSTKLLPSTESTAFVVEAIDGKTYLIGCKEHPTPQVKCTHSFAAAKGDGAGFFYEITHTAIKSLIECQVFL